MLLNTLDGHTITDPARMEHPSMTTTAQRPYRGVFPVAPTIFDDRGELDLEGQRRCIDFMIDAGSQRPVHPRQFLRAVRADRCRARDA